MKEKKVIFENDQYIVVKVTTEKKRYYTIFKKKTGETFRLASVTTITGLLDKPALVYWSAKVTAEYLALKLEDIKAGELILTKENIPEICKQARFHFNAVKKQSASIGSKAHKLIEKYLKKLPYEEILKNSPNQVKTAFKAFLRWKKKYKFEVIEAEQTVWHEKYLYAGTLDIVGNITIKGKKYLTIIDLKTSNEVYSDYIMQLASYVKAYEKRKNTKVKKIGLLRLDKDTGIPEYIPYTLKTINHAFKKFLCLVKYYYLNKEKI